MNYLETVANTVANGDNPYRHHSMTLLHSLGFSDVTLKWYYSDTKAGVCKFARSEMSMQDMESAIKHISYR